MNMRASSIVALLVAALYIAGLSGMGSPGADCACDMGHASLKCYCCEGEKHEASCGLSAAFEGCGKAQKAALSTEETTALAEPLLAASLSTPTEVVYADTSARLSAGFDKLPERPPTA